MKEEFSETTSAVTGFDAVTEAMPMLTTLMNQVWTLMTSNPLLALFLAVSLLGIGVGVFRTIKRSARR